MARRTLKDHVAWWFAFLLGATAITGFFFPATRAAHDVGYWWVGLILGVVATGIYWVLLMPLYAGPNHKEEAIAQAGGLGDLMGFFVMSVGLCCLYEPSSTENAVGVDVGENYDGSITKDRWAADHTIFLFLFCPFLCVFFYIVLYVVRI